MSAHVFSDAVVWSKRRLPAGDAAVLALALVALLTVIGALWFGNQRQQAPAPPPPAAAPSAIETAAEPVRAHPLPRRRVRAERAEPSAIRRAEPAAALTEYDPFGAVERVSAEEMDGISQAR